MRWPTAPGPPPIRRVYPAEVAPQRLAAGQVDHGAVEGAESVPAPVAPLRLVVRALEAPQHRLLIELDKGRVGELGARLRPGAWSVGRQAFEALRQAALEALNPFLEQQQDHARKGVRCRRRLKA